MFSLFSVLPLNVILIKLLSFLNWQLKLDKCTTPSGGGTLSLINAYNCTCIDRAWTPSSSSFLSASLTILCLWKQDQKNSYRPRTDKITQSTGHGQGVWLLLKLHMGDIRVHTTNIRVNKWHATIQGVLHVVSSIAWYCIVILKEDLLPVLTIYP
jgi:hypothetical protein